jgi:hypothetical protein
VLRELRRSVAARVDLALESTGFLAALSGASLAAAFGRFLLALLLASLALGIGFRLVGRQRIMATARPKVPVLAKASALALSMAEVAALVEATDAPVRFHQEGFSSVHWVLVLVAVAVAYLVQVRLIASVSRRFFHPKP